MGLFQKTILPFKQRTHLKETKQLIFLKRLNKLLQEGYPLQNALQSLQWDKAMTQTVNKIIYKIKKGSHLDEAFDDAGFHEMIVSTLYFIRINGDLTGNIIQSIQIFEQHIQNKQKFIQAIRYPLILTFIFLILLYFVKTSILPTFVQFFQMNASTSHSVFTFISIINITINSLVLIIGFALVSFVCYLFFRKKITIENKILLISKIPILSRFITIKTSFYFANYFSTFLKAGLSFKTILEHMNKQTKLPILSYYANHLGNHLSQGFRLADQFKQFSLIDSRMVNIFNNINNEILEQDLRAYANVLYDTFQQKLLRIMTLIQPIFFVVLACFIVFIYATLMWPMLEFIQSM